MKNQLLLPMLMITLVFALILTGCAEQSTDAEFDIKTAKIGVVTGTMAEIYADANYPKENIFGYDAVTDTVAALLTKKIDAVITADITAINVTGKNPELEVYGERLTDEEIAVGISKENTRLLEEFNETIALLKEDGTLEDMKKRWIKLDGSPVEPVDIPQTGEAVLRVGLAADREPFAFLDADGNVTGLCAELAQRVGRQHGYKIEFSIINFTGLIPALQSGKIDAIVDAILVTEERKLQINFSDSYYMSGQIAMKRKDKGGAEASGILTPTSKPGDNGREIGVITGTTGEQFTAGTYRAEDFEGKSFAVWTGSIFDKVVERYITNPELMYFNTPQECIEAVKTGKADASVSDEPAARKLAAQNPEIKLLYPLITTDEYGVVFNKQNTALRDSFNKFLKEIQNNGVYDDIVSRWLDTADSPNMPDIPLTGENGKLVFGSSGVDEPFSYIKDGRTVGYDVEIALRFAQYMGMELDIRLMDFGGMLPAVQSGKIDFAGDLITITEERSQFVDFSDPYYIGGAVTSVRDSTGGTAEKASFWQGVQRSFYQNLIVENRWQTLVKGLSVTMLISVFAFILATLIGFATCFMRMSRNSLLRGIASVYITVLRGTPIVVLLMITYYIIFASVNINPTLVAVIAFGFNGGAFIGEIIRSAILTVDKGQVEAARSMGFSKIGAFLTVTLPQAVRVALPVYKSEFISMVKATAIVGYIAIIDLTKAGDIIRSRTYDAFFPLIIVALIYLAATGILVWIFDKIGKLTDKRKRRAKR